MSHNYYSEIHLHMVWHTKTSIPLLTPEVEAVAHRWVWQKLVNTQGAYVHEIGGTETHMHVCVTLPPTILFSELVGQLKGGSAHEMNETIGRRSKRLQWQTGYGVVSFGEKTLPWVKAYVRDQRKHHAAGTTYERLERIAASADGSGPKQRETP